MIQFGPYQFRPQWLLTILMLILVLIAISLGNWQLNRAEYKEKIEQMRELNSSRGVTRLSNSSRASDAQFMLYRDVYVDGNFDLDHQLLLDNQKYRGEPGYHVFTPMRLQGGEMHILGIAGNDD